MKRILGLDLGTNSIGWAVIEIDENGQRRIARIGSRIIPMDHGVMSDFGAGIIKSQTAERTTHRGVRRLIERSKLRRERLHRVLNIMGFLPQHYAENIDFEKRFGQFINHSEPKLAYKTDITGNNKPEFIFKHSFEEMLSDFKVRQPQLLIDENGEAKKVPYDWTIYYLRKKALSEKIEREELAWIILNFNQKRGYYQQRGEEEEEEKDGKRKEYHKLLVVDVKESGDKKSTGDTWYNVVLENGWIYRRASKIPLFDWKGKVKEFIVTTDVDVDGNVKKDKDGNEIRSFTAPKEDDWTLIKKRTEIEVRNSGKTVGEYIYEAILIDPKQKITGKLITVVERKFYRDELEQILNKQKEFHSELKDTELYNRCLNELYRHNDAHKNNINKRDFTYLFLNDILFYHRPLKSKKHLISNCRYEYRNYINKKTGESVKEYLKCTSTSNPLFQELRLWKFIKNLKVYEREQIVDGKVYFDVNVTEQFFKEDDDWVNLFAWLNERATINQKAFLDYPKLGLKKNTDKYRWNYVEDKDYPCNETRSLIVNKLKGIFKPIKVDSKECALSLLEFENKPLTVEQFLTSEIEMHLWHILYSVEDKEELSKALNTFAKKQERTDKTELFDDDECKLFVDALLNLKPFTKDYAAYSEKAIKKLLPLLRMGKYWKEEDISKDVKNRLIQIGERLESVSEDGIISVADDDIQKAMLKSFQNCQNIIKGLGEHQACYAVYGKYAEEIDIQKWNTPGDINQYLNSFRQHSLNNPIVEQIVLETLRTVRDIWQELGNGESNYFSEIHIELGREMKNTKKDREKLTKIVTKNENTNLRIKALLIELSNDKGIENVRTYSPYQQDLLQVYEEGVLNSGIEIPDDMAKISKMSSPTQSQLQKYKLWLEQKYCSPYTGQIIPLSRLFTTDYEIEHVIPQSIYFDNSMTNKVICEAVVNKNPYKGNQLAYNFIKKMGGQIVTELSTPNRTVKILTLDEYKAFVNKHYTQNQTKKKKLLLEEIPDSFISRQMNDSKYISKLVRNLLSKIVREEGEQSITSKNILSCNGTITSILRQDWGLNDVWNTLIYPRFERMNELTNSNLFGKWENKEGKHVFQTDMPLELQKGFSKKRIDHRHHALDALVIACATLNHVNYLNNQSAKSEKSRYDLKNNLCYKKQQDNGNYAWKFNKPWDTFTQDAKEALQSIIVSFKSNVRVINKTVNEYQKFEDGAKKPSKYKQEGKNLAIRKPLHKDTVSGRVTLRFEKEILLPAAIDNVDMIIDKNFKKEIKKLQLNGLDKKKVIKHFKELDNKFEGKDITRVQIYYYDENYYATRKAIDDSFDEKKIKSITDRGIQAIMLRHLNQEKYQNQTDENGKSIPAERLAFSSDGICDMNQNITQLNGGKKHQPIYKVRVFESSQSKFRVGVNGNKNSKYVEGAKGTNLFFAIYQKEDGTRTYASIPFYEVLERQKQGVLSVPEKDKDDNELLFFLSPNDLVYVPTKEEIEVGNIDLSNKSAVEITKRIYKMVSCDQGTCYFLPNNIATVLQNKMEIESKNKTEWTIEDRISIKGNCIKLKVNRLGQIEIK